MYPAQWNAEQGRLVGLEEFGRCVYDELLASINEEFGTEAPEPVDEFAEEMARQEAFVSERTARYVVGSRQPVLDRVAEFVSADGEPSILAITGAPGCGKSAFLAKAYQDLTAVHPDWLVVPHFVGASAGSTDLRRSLRRLCHELQGTVGADEPLPDGVEELITRLPTLLEQAGTTRRVVLVIDALNQMDPTDGAHTLRWLPYRLPRNVRIVVSSLAHPVLDALRLRREQVLELELAPLTSADARAIVEGFAARYHKRLSEEQLEALLAKPESGSPLYLLVALEELRTLGTYEEITTRIEQLPGGVRELFLWILQERLSTDPGFQDAQGNLVGAELVRRCVSHLGVSRHGLSHAELVGTVDPGEPRGNVAALERLLRPYLMRRGELLDFYHGQLREAVEAEYLDEEHERLEAHRSLALYFSQQGYGNVRTLAELPYHQTQAGMWEDLEGTLTDLQFLEGKVTAGMTFELAGDFTAAVEGLPADRPGRRTLQLLEEAIRRDIHFIARHADDYPQGLFQCLWNTCWWYDCREAAKHYETPKGGWPPGEPPWEQPGLKLSKLLEDWRAAKESLTSGFHWVCCLRPPPVHLATAQKGIMRGHDSAVLALACSHDAHRIASGSEDETVRVWDLETGAQLLCIRGHSGDVTGVAYSPDDQYIASASYDQTVRVWDAETGSEIQCLRGHDNKVLCVAFSPDGRRIVSGSWDKTVRVWDAENGDPLKCLRGHKERVQTVAYLKGGRQIVSGSRDGVRMWDAESGAEMRRFTGADAGDLACSPDGKRLAYVGWGDAVRVCDLESGDWPHGDSDVHECDVLRCVSYSPDARRIVAGSEDEMLHVWDAETGVELQWLRGHEGFVVSVQHSPDGRWIISGSLDGTIRVWDPDASAELRSVRGHEYPVTSVRHSPEGSRILSSSDDATMRLWSARTGEQIQCIEGHRGEVHCGAFAPDGLGIASVSEDQTFRIWDARTGIQRRCLHDWYLGFSVAYSPSGRQIITGGEGGEVQVWDADTGESLNCFKGHEDFVTCVAYSPDARRIASGGDFRDATVRVWDVETGIELHCLYGHEGPISSVAWSPDGRLIVSGSRPSVREDMGGDRHIKGSWHARVWDAETGECLDVIQGVGDVQAIAAGPAQFPLRAVSRRQETIVERADGGQPVSYFPIRLEQISTHPNGRTWAGSSHNHVYIIALEGDPIAPPAEPPEQQ